MAPHPRKGDVLTNPFHLGLLAVSAAFVLTALAYLAAGPALDPARSAPQAGASRRAALWLDRYGPRLLAAELALMLPASALMILIDGRRDRARRQARERRKSG
ncbi:hypothetical protein [Paludisphaera soli]|uniref:hypothetical protein n=1 Tax=Paludisphaera soli TaxID=2712865 RepID=UPI0013E9B6A3|nr:hypothetical protein [Paludisphaera soli]